MPKKAVSILLHEAKALLVLVCCLVSYDSANKQKQYKSYRTLGKPTVSEH